MEDSLCNQVWQFSKEHDFSVIFKQYPFVTHIDRAKQETNRDEDGRILCIIKIKS